MAIASCSLLPLLQLVVVVVAAATPTPTPTATPNATPQDSDYERLKARAELSYLNGDYVASTKAWLAILGQYKIGTKGRPGGLRLEALDSICRCNLQTKP